MHWMFGNYGMGYGGGVGFLMIFFWILVVMVVVKLIKGLLGGNKHGVETLKPAGEPAEEILKKRYARGEISEEEFKRIRDNIR